MSSNDLSVQVHSGVTRVSVGGNSEPEVEQADEALAKVHGGALVYDSRSGEVQSGEYLQTQVSGAEFNNSQGILATARTKLGAPARELTPDTIVEVDGMTVELRHLEGLYVRRDAAGRYVEIPAAERQGEQSAEGDAGEIRQELFPQEIEAALAHVAEGVDSETLTPLMVEHAIQFGDTGTLNVTMEEVVSRTGLPKDRAEAFTNLATAALSAQVNSELAKSNVDPAAFLQWALQRRPAEFKAAVVAQVSARSLHGYRSLAQEYMRETVPTEEALRRGGLETKRDAMSKQLLVNINGTWMSAAAAARSGLV
jgi:hypothetical protein